MKFNFDINTTTTTTTQSLMTTPTTTTTKPPPPPLIKNKQETTPEWYPLQSHPIFTTLKSNNNNNNVKNLMSWDGSSSRLYFWDQNKHSLHRLTLRLGEPEPTSVIASSPSKVLQADVELDFVVDTISINRNGSAMVLSGSDGLTVMFFYGATSHHTQDNNTTVICRTVSVGAQLYFDTIRILHFSWHPFSDTHLGILSSDSVFRLFDLSSDIDKPEQEYYLQPVEPGACRNAASICPISFSFGAEHLWDRFAVFVLFSDGSVYVLCPVVPFGSVYRWECIAEIYNDAHTFGLKSSNSRAVSNSSLAIAWLEATFPELTHQETRRTLLVLRAHPYVPFDASLYLQGPLRKVCHGKAEDGYEVEGSKCEGRAVSFLYNSISKDSVLVTAWSSGQLQIDALADEVQPVWNVGILPRVSVDSHEKIYRVAMICEPNLDELSVVKLDQPLDQTVWLGHPPPLLRLAMVDLALPRHIDNYPFISLWADPLIPERIYCSHSGGIDSIVLHFLPFTSQTCGKDETVRAPSVYPVLSTCHSNNYSPSPLSGFVTLGDSFGYSWIVGVTSSQECVVVEMKGWDARLPLHIFEDNKFIISEDLQEADIRDIISKDLLCGPKVLVPQTSPNLRSVTADSIEGRSTLHQYFKLFHENYVEYAHKVWFELKHHQAPLKRIIDDQRARLGEAQQKLLKIEEKQPKLENRINRAFEVHKHLEERLQTLRNLPGANKKPLSRSEREFKAELDRFTGVELDALRSSIETLNARLRKHTRSPQGNALFPPKEMPGKRKIQVPDAQISDLRSAIRKLSLVNSENTQKVKLVESALKSKETSN